MIYRFTDCIYSTFSVLYTIISQSTTNLGKNIYKSE